MNRIIAATAVALSFAAPAFASDQLALSLGVTPGQYSTAELAILKDASTKTDNEGTVYFDNNFAFSASAASSQLAASLGVDADLPLNKLIELKDAAEETSNDRIVFIK